MPILLDHQLLEKDTRKNSDFPVAYYQNELEALPNWEGPFHWHPDFEIATALNNSLEYQIDQQQIILNAGDSIFVNGNILHKIKQISGNNPDSVPIIVFSGTSIAPEHSLIYKKYILPILNCDNLPFIIFYKDDSSFAKINALIQKTYNCFINNNNSYEMEVQRNLSNIMEYIFLNLDHFPRIKLPRMEIKHQIRIQKMLSYIYENYMKKITLEEIAKAANISRSEAGRCFKTYLGSPIEVLIQYRLQVAHKMLSEKTHTLQEISLACGFNSVNYFSRQFKKFYKTTPGKISKLGK